jgi:hypothetical protein
MVNQSRTTSQLPQKTSCYDSNDSIVFVYGADTANTSNSVAQTATISVNNFLNQPNLSITAGVLIAANLQINSTSSDPTTSSSLEIVQGTVWVTNSYLYVATQNNFVQRVALSSF